MILLCAIFIYKSWQIGLACLDGSPRFGPNFATRTTSFFEHRFRWGLFARTRINGLGQCRSVGSILLKVLCLRREEKNHVLALLWRENVLETRIQNFDGTDNILSTTILNNKNSKWGTFLTMVTDTPLLTSESATQPPKLADNAIVSQGNTQISPDSVRLNFSTYNGLLKSLRLSMNVFLSSWCT